MTVKARPAAGAPAGATVGGCGAAARSGAVKAFTEDLKAHGGDPEKVTAASLDMSKAFIKGVTEALPNAKITFDPFHLIKLMNDALGQVR